ncbi:MAG: hypothetical protein HY952_04805 [Elusimicrobia bacterium]|nr:hypothetical protein [Elusimicrobiota bacterium]
MKKAILTLAIWAAGCGLVSAGATITYQGRLKESGTPVSANRSFIFQFCQTPIPTGCTASPDGAQSFQVVNGLFKSTFTAPGVDYVNGPWYLRVLVEWTPLLPLEQLTFVPYAVQAASSAYASGLAVNSGEGVYASTNVFVGGSMTVSDWGTYVSTETALAGAALLQDKNPGTQDVRVGVMGYARSDSGDATDILAGGNFEAEVPVGKTGTAVGLRGVTRNYGNAPKTYAVLIDAVQNTGNIGETYGLWIATLTAGTQAEKPYAIYSIDPNARHYFSGPVGISSAATAYSLAVSSASGDIFWVGSDGAHAIKFVGDGSGLTGVTGASGTDNTKVAKAGDTMTGQLTISGSTLTVRGPSGPGTTGLLWVSTSVSTPAFFVSTQGFTGINVASPQYPLHIVSNQGGQVAMQIDGYDSSHDSLRIDSKGTGSPGTVYLKNGSLAAITEADTGGLHIAVGPMADEKVTITPDTKVGVGTTSPAYRLHVSSGAGEAGNLLVISTGASNVVRMTGDGSVYANRYYGNGSALTGVSADLNSPVGTLAIGDGGTGATTAASARAALGALSLTGDTMSGQLTVSGSSITVLATAAQSGELWLSTSTFSPHLFVSTTGLVGIGTETPIGQHRLRVAGGGMLLDDATAINWAIGGSFVDGVVRYDSSNGLQFRGPASGILFKNSGNSEIARLVSDGSFGLGINPPNAKLDVVSTGAASGIYAQFWRNNSSVIVASMSSTGDLMAVRFIGDGSGLTGVAAVTGLDSSKLPLAGGTLTGQLTLAGSTLTVTGPAFSVAGSTFTVASGNVGIGAAAPAVKLQVNTVSAAGSVVEALRLGNPATGNNTGAALTFYNNGPSFEQAGISGFYDLPTTGNTLAFYTGNSHTEQMRIVGNGFVAVGTTTPQAKFDVFGGSIMVRGTNAALVLNDSARVILPETVLPAAGLRVSTNVYIVGISSAARYFGDGSALTGVPGDNLGNHTASQQLNMAMNPVVNISSVVTYGLYISSLGVIQSTGPGMGMLAGSPRGTGAVDLQTNRGAASQVASGMYSTLGGGSYNQASGVYSAVPGGSYNSAVGQYAFAAGYAATSTGDNTFTWSDSGGNFIDNTVQDRAVFKAKAGFMVTGSTSTVLGTTVNRGALIKDGMLALSTGVPMAAIDVVSTGAAANVYAQIWRDNTGLVVASMTANGRFSTLQAIPGDNLGNHNATQNLQMNWFDILTVSTISAVGRISAAYYQVNASTVLALSAGGGSLGLGIDAGRVNTGGYNVFIGSAAGYGNTTGTNNVFLGYQAGYNNVSANSNNFVGWKAGFSNTGGNNNFFGNSAGYSNTSGLENSYFGDNAGYNNSSGRYNANFGNSAGMGSAATYSSATLVGHSAGYSLTSGGGNTFLGYSAGYNVTSGTGNIVIGASQDLASPVANGQLNIGGVIFGDLAAKAIGISTRAPQAALDIVSTATAANVYAQIWRNGTGVVVASVTSQGGFYGNGAGLTGIAVSAVPQSGVNLSTVTAAIAPMQAAISTAVYTANSYTDPAWITGLATSKINLSTVTATLAGKVSRAGDTMTGPFAISGSSFVLRGGTGDLMYIDSPSNWALAYLTEAGATQRGQFGYGNGSSVFGTKEIPGSMVMNGNLALQLGGGGVMAITMMGGRTGVAMNAPLYALDISTVAGDQYVMRAGPDGIIISTGGAIQTTGYGHGSSVGGARGLGAVDLQTSRTNGTQVASGNFTFIGGGEQNSAGTIYSVVGGGQMNVSNGAASFIGSGYGNSINIGYGTIAGGFGNSITINGADGAIAGGLYNKVDALDGAIAGGAHNTVYAAEGFIGGGTYNVVSGSNSAIGGGAYNTILTTSAVIAGGENNKAYGKYSAVLGGSGNLADMSYASVLGGINNSAQGFYSSIGGGYINVINGGATSAVIGGGEMNAIGLNAGQSTVAGGYGNSIQDSSQYSTIAGGKTNVVALNTAAAAILGGSNNQVNASSSTVAGGHNNWANATLSFVGAGYNNRANGVYSGVGAGSGNEADLNADWVGGGAANISSGVYATVGGGFMNSAMAMAATVAGGYGNVAGTMEATVGGGQYNSAIGNYSVIPGGFRNSAVGNYSFAAGYKSSSTAMGAFTWTDSEGAMLDNNVQDQVRFKARGGFWVSVSTQFGNPGLFVTSSNTVVVGATMASPPSKVTIIEPTPSVNPGANQFVLLLSTGGLTPIMTVSTFGVVGMPAQSVAIASAPPMALALTGWNAIGSFSFEELDTQNEMLPAGFVARTQGRYLVTFDATMNCATANNTVGVGVGVNGEASPSRYTTSYAGIAGTYGVSFSHVYNLQSGATLQFFFYNTLASAFNNFVPMVTVTKLQ